MRILHVLTVYLNEFGVAFFVVGLGFYLLHLLSRNRISEWQLGGTPGPLDSSAEHGERRRSHIQGHDSARFSLRKPQFEADHVVACSAAVVNNSAGSRYVADDDVVLRGRLFKHDLQQMHGW